MITNRQIRAARMLAEWDQKTLAEKSGVSLPTIQRLEKLGPLRSTAANVAAVEDAFRAVGIEFTPENGGGEGVRFKLHSKDRPEAQ